MRKMPASAYTAKLAVLILIAGLLPVFSAQAQVTIFGLKSCGSGSPGFCGSGTIPDSLPPTNLFSFQDNGSGFVDHGAVTLSGSGIDADGLAFSQSQGLLAFELQKSGTATTGSTLISIDPNSALATGIGSFLSGRDIRGAVFDQSDSLWALDAANDELLNIDTATGAVLGSPVGLNIAANAFNLSDVSDIAVRLDGSFYVGNDSDIYTLDIGSGELTLANTDSVQGFSGMAFANDTPQDALLAFDVNGFEDIFRYDLDAGFSQSTLFLNIIPSYNSGRGDLAAFTPIPEPSTTVMLGFGLILIVTAGIRGGKRLRSTKSGMA